MRFFPLRIFLRHSSNTRLQVFQNATQIVDPQRIRNIGIIAHIDAGSSRRGIGNKIFQTVLFRENNDGRTNVISCRIYSFDGKCR